ncbi:hypothetical protein [Streptomyces sp. ISL-94]|uniref:hypothetical protein n=1 Tax=Streptomyces sp. ISL-94 TaxID=2819190 RepID=UPI001BE5CA2E|nr:hypothetical protein [Streptomyces sp. ISL-94]MBT2481457.1 hypothetical protein [Streptomyces sp. ISL-94]
MRLTRPEPMSASTVPPRPLMSTWPDPAVTFTGMPTGTVTPSRTAQPAPEAGQLPMPGQCGVSLSVSPSQLSSIAGAFSDQLISAR